MPDRAQVIIRIVPGGGTKSLQQIINQLEYLSRKGKLELQRSARHLDIPVPPDQIRELAQSWVTEAGIYDESQSDDDRQQDLTTHIIVSFPAGTDQTAAYEASREWAAEMFGSGYGGGRYNYLTAYHVDRDHPHLHVVVNRRELLGQGWLKISRRHPQLNYDGLRKKMAEISLRHGIVLDATSRAERGIAERPITYAEYRRLERMQAQKIQLEDTDFDETSPEEDRRDLSQSFDPFRSDASTGEPDRATRHDRQPLEPHARFQEPAGSSIKADARIRVPLESERSAQPSASKIPVIGHFGIETSYVAEASVPKRSGNSDTSRPVTDVAMHTVERQQRSKRRHDEEAGPSGVNRKRLKAAQVDSEANVGEPDGRDDSNKAADPVSASIGTEQPEASPTRPRDRHDGELGGRKRARGNRRDDGRGGDLETGRTE
ncbi:MULTISPECIES: T-DNA border endonuclease VirD2 [Agrobacterium]|uniref:Type IV secretion system protein VirD n=2 Tax=Agrobacterium TaxID=357 RepID=A0A2Z2PPE0_9HYPH|nr:MULTISPECIES: T-DNA border endonuclease VirD2 [Agrobacterium]ASK41986.1 type IV secretion system protein VirD [Agrobacterium fabrum]ASK49547.1 integrase [Agrobacterium larrymoorei]NSL21165.1 T-DNA border endonuclease VirD2 [Agrobacterium tumefaciens]NSZ03079.1 T-DNA border endonuclease VirD2 [Agrobacterium tumefaciens]NSZ39694.1 T-DNA border endonuclease VirD2 [Agrobacterium tumefaciens]